MNTKFNNAKKYLLLTVEMVTMQKLGNEAAEYTLFEEVEAVWWRMKEQERDIVNIIAKAFAKDAISGEDVKKLANSLSS